MRNWTLRLAACAMAVLLAACSAPALPGLARSHPSPSSTPVKTQTGTGSIDAFVPQAISFVEAHRGLRFKQPVKVNHLSDAAFAQRIVSLQQRDRADTDRQAKIYRALGLVGRNVDVEKAEEQLLSSGVVGYYDPKTKELVVRGDTASLSVKHVVVHELTHALQDQWFGLDTDQRGQTDDHTLAYVSLVEGDAVRIEREYVASLSSGERQQLAKEESALGAPPSDVPSVLVELLTFPYVAGPPFVSAVLHAKGQSGLDGAFKETPAGTNQVVQPDLFLGGEVPQMVTEPGAEGPAFDRGVLGEAQMGVLLESGVASGALSRDQEQTAARTWAGDRYVAWSSGDNYCVRVRFAARSAAGAAQLGSALQKVPGGSARVQVEQGSQPVLTSCG
jgi:hypothetical protein